MSSAPVAGDQLDELTALAERFSAHPFGDPLPERIGDDLIRFRHAIDLLELAFAAKATLFADTDESDRDGAITPCFWMRHTCHMASGAAASALTVGDHMPSLPQSVAALQDGRIGFAHLALLARTAEDIGASGTGIGFDEAPLLRRAEEHSVTRFRQDCEHARHAHDAEAVLAEHVGAVEDRSLELMPCGGALFLRGFLDATGAATLRTALEALAHPNGAGDTRDRQRRLADALVELAVHGLDTGELPLRGGVRPHLQVTASLETLRGLPGAPAGELEFGGTIPAATVQRLACDAAITRILLGPGSVVVDVGRARRVPAAGTRKALRLRDAGCVWPGCERTASWTEAHHIRHWALDHGATEVPNLALLCHTHHWKVHEGGWQLVKTDDERLVTIPPLPERLPPARTPDPVSVA